MTLTSLSFFRCWNLRLINWLMKHGNQSENIRISNFCTLVSDCLKSAIQTEKLDEFLKKFCTQKWLLRFQEGQTSAKLFHVLFMSFIEHDSSKNERALLARLVRRERRWWRRHKIISKIFITMSNISKREWMLNMKSRDSVFHHFSNLY